MTFTMQIDMWNDVTLIPLHYRVQMGKPKSKKSNLKFRQVDGSFIRTLAYFNKTFAACDRFEIIPITVVEYKQFMDY